MPICITCCTPVRNLYTTYSKADDRSLGKGVRLTQCPNCKRFADKYVEHDYVVLFIDLVLIKPQVYRHLLFNRLWTPNDALDPSILRLGILLILFDVYITWARIEKANSISDPSSATGQRGSNFSSAPIITQYLFFLTLNVVATVVQHAVIRGLAKVLVRSPDGHLQSQDKVDFAAASPTGHSRSSSSPSKLLRGQRPASPNLNRSPSPKPNRPTSNPRVVSAPMPTSSAPASTSTSALPTPTTTATTASLDEPPTATLTPSQSSLASSVTGTTNHRPSTTNHAATHSTDSNATTTSPAAQPKPSPSHPAQSSYSRPYPSAISTALLISSCTKLFPILLVIWPTPVSADAPDAPGAPTTMSAFAHRATSYIGWIVLLNNIEALLILLNCGYVVATALGVGGVLARWLVEGWMLGVVGLVREMEGPVGDVCGLLGWVAGWEEMG